MFLSEWPLLFDALASCAQLYFLVFEKIRYSLMLFFRFQSAAVFFCIVKT